MMQILTLLLSRIMVRPARSPADCHPPSDT
jgi:hypothetical protein